MFSRIEADIPMWVPGSKHPVLSRFSVDNMTGMVKIEAESFEVANHLLELMRVNNIVQIAVSMGYIPEREAEE